MNSNTCECRTDDGFRFDNSVTPQVCEPCQIQNCKKCSVDKNLCDLDGCRENFSRTDSGTCECPTDGFRFEAASDPQFCEACQVENCKNCTSDKAFCDLGGCRLNFIQSDKNTCACPSDGYRLDNSVTPKTCDACQV